MSSKLINIVLFLSNLFCMTHTEQVIYYITPSFVLDLTCVVNDRILRPCCSLHQLNTTSISNKSSVTLRLLPGIHLLPEYFNFTLVNVGDLEISPWDFEQEVKIKCRSSVYFTFENFGAIAISALKLISCPIECRQTDIFNGIKDVVLFSDCLFTGSRQKYAITLADVSQASIKNCTLNSNYGGIKSINRFSTRLLIMGTIWLNNYRRRDNGSAVYIEGSKLTLINSKFINNTALSGGAIYSYGSELSINDVLFIKNTALSGGAIYSWISDVILDHTVFKENLAEQCGGANCFRGSRVQVNQINNCYFLNNVANESGGGVYSESNIFVQHTVFTGNGAKISGSAVYFGNDFGYNIFNISYCYFKSNFATASGGGIYYFNVFEGEIANTNFQDNHAGACGDAVYFYASCVNIAKCTFSNNSAEVSGGAVYINGSITYFIQGAQININKTNFTSNRARFNGGAIYCNKVDKQYITISQGCYSSYNSARNGGFAYLMECRIIIEEGINIAHGSASFNGGAIYASRSLLDLSGNLVYNYSNNLAYNTVGNEGGALYLSNNSSLVIDDNCFLAFDHNAVTSKSGS